MTSAPSADTLTPNMSSSSSSSESMEPTNESSVSVAVAPTPAVPTRVVECLPQWKVLLHNDEKSEMDYVVESIVRFVRASVPTATRCMVEAHRKGVSLLTVTHQEHAELLSEQFRSARLVVTIEPA